MADDVANEVVACGCDFRRRTRRSGELDEDRRVCRGGRRGRADEREQSDKGGAAKTHTFIVGTKVNFLLTLLRDGVGGRSLD